MYCIPLRCYKRKTNFYLQRLFPLFYVYFLCSPAKTGIQSESGVFKYERRGQMSEEPEIIAVLHLTVSHPNQLGGSFQGRADA